MLLLCGYLVHQRLGDNQRRQEALALTSFSLQWLVTGVFWLVVWPERGWSSVTDAFVESVKHTIPLGVHLHESFAGAPALRPSDAGVPILFAAAYAIWLAAAHAAFGWDWPYDFAEPFGASPLTFAAGMAGLAAVVALCAAWTLLLHYYIMRELRRAALGEDRAAALSLLLADDLAHQDTPMRPSPHPPDALEMA
ncbi:hypothetical protein HK405_012543, partial [Cladochytrium tenue]